MIDTTAAAILRGRKVFQTCWVVPDLNRAIADWMETMGVGPFFRLSPTYEQLFYRDTPTEVNFEVALAQAGDLQIELIAVVDDRPSVYRDLIPPGGRGFHHVAIMAEDYDADLAMFQAQGFSAAMHGVRNGKRMAYLDTSKTLGFMVELLEACPWRHDFFRRVADAAVGWDGSDPIRRA